MSPVSPSRAATQIACAAQRFQESDSDVDADAESGQSDDEQQRLYRTQVDVALQQLLAVAATAEVQHDGARPVGGEKADARDDIRMDAKAQKRRLALERRDHAPPPHALPPVGQLHRHHPTLPVSQEVVC